MTDELAVQEKLDKLAIMRDALAAATEKIETGYGIGFKELEKDIKEFARANFSVGEFVQGEWLEVYLSDGRVITNNDGVDALIQMTPALELLLKKKGDPSPSIRKVDKSRPSTNGDQLADSQES